MPPEVGSVVGGKVTGISKFGAFVQIEGGKSGMVHISEISNSYVSDINEFLKDGQEVRVKIIGIDEKGRINLSIKKAQVCSTESVREVPEHTAPKTLSFEEMMSKFKQESDDKLSGFKMKETNRRSPYTKHSSK